MGNGISKIMKNRRQAPDKWIHILRFLVILSWAFFIVSLIVSFYAAPEEDYGLLRYKDIEIRDYWLKPLTGYLYITLWSCALISLVCLIITSFRSRRAQDSKMFNLMLLIITVTSWITYVYTQVNS